MFEAFRGQRGDPMARGYCCDCSATAEIRSLHERTRGSELVAIEGDCIRKFQNLGWTHIKGKLRCPSCTTKRNDKPKNEGELTMAQAPAADLRQPTREQKRQIIELLGEVYDTKTERYHGKETDQTVAETIGNGVMFGWVASIREELFGPDGGNEEAEELLRDIAIWRKNAEVKALEMHANLKDFNEARQKVADLFTRLESLRKSIGPKGARA